MHKFRLLSKKSSFAPESSLLAQFWLKLHDLFRVVIKDPKTVSPMSPCKISLKKFLAICFSRIVVLSNSLVYWLKLSSQKDLLESVFGLFCFVSSCFEVLLEDSGKHSEMLQIFTSPYSLTIERNPSWAGVGSTTLKVIGLDSSWKRQTSSALDQRISFGLIARRQRCTWKSVPATSKQ